MKKLLLLVFLLPLVARAPVTNVLDHIRTIDINGAPTTNVQVICIGPVTNTFCFTNGLLMAVKGPTAPVHGPSWAWPGGGHITWPSGSTILLP